MRKTNGNGIHHLDRAALPVLRRADVALDNTGVITKDHDLLHACRSKAFEEFGRGFGDSERDRMGIRYTIDGAIVERLGTVRGYNTGPSPVEAIMAVNMLAGDRDSYNLGVAYKGREPRDVFIDILNHEDSVGIFDRVRDRYLTPFHRELAKRMYLWYDTNVYKNPDASRHMRGIPESVEATMRLYRQCAREGRRLSIVTDTPNRELFYQHLSAAGFTDAQIGELKKDLLVITQGEVRNRKPDPEGLRLVKRDGVSLIFVGDTVRDGETAQNGEKGGMRGVMFGAVLSGGSEIDALKRYGPVVIADNLATITREVFRA